MLQQVRNCSQISVKPGKSSKFVRKTKINFRTESTTKWLLNNTSPDERLLTRNWAHTDEVIDARKTPKIARRSNVSGLVDFEPVRRLPPPMSPFVREKIVPLQEQLETHSYYSLFDPEDNSFIV